MDSRQTMNTDTDQGMKALDLPLCNQRSSKCDSVQLVPFSPMTLRPAASHLDVNHELHLIICSVSGYFKSQHGSIYGKRGTSHIEFSL